MTHDSPQFIQTRFTLLAAHTQTKECISFNKKHQGLSVHNSLFHTWTEGWFFLIRKEGPSSLYGIGVPLPYMESGCLFLIWNQGAYSLYGIGVPLPYMKLGSLFLIWNQGAYSLYGRKWLMFIEIQLTSVCCGSRLALPWTSWIWRTLSELRDNWSSAGTQGFLAETRERNQCRLHSQLVQQNRRYLQFACDSFCCLLQNSLSAVFSTWQFKLRTFGRLSSRLLWTW